MEDEIPKEKAQPTNQHQITAAMNFEPDLPLIFQHIQHCHELKTVT